MPQAYQPIIRGIQAVGQVKVLYRYNLSKDGGKNFYMPIPENLIKILELNSTNVADEIAMGSEGVEVSGFRLDSTFFAAQQQIASSAVIPILGGGGVALTNNNRTGSLTLTCAKVSTPEFGADKGHGRMFGGDAEGVGVRGGVTVYDMVLLAQIQQAQPGGDSVGANLTIGYEFCGRKTKLVFEACTVADVAPIIMAGNDAATYNVTLNYLNWNVDYNVGAL